MRVFLFDWDRETAARRAAALEAAGIDVETESAAGARGCKAVLDHSPEAVLFSLERRPSHSRETASGIRSCKAGRRIPVILFGGKPEDVEKTRACVPGAVFTARDGLLEALRTTVSQNEA